MTTLSRRSALPLLGISKDKLILCKPVYHERSLCFAFVICIYFNLFSFRVSDDDDELEDEPAREWIDSEVDEDEVSVDKDDVESMFNRVTHMIRGRSDLQELKLVECKAYLRRHRLRLSGTKEECIERIKEHWWLKNGNCETLYPRSSFVINCTGDVCKGDVVVFNQKVNQIINKGTRNRGLQRRTVAGRIIKESYGAAKQQHTFTVEVLWSKGAKKLDPLTPLLVKGRNLYKMKTYRQRWKNEKERFEVLDEKHKRGAAARTIRAMRNTKAVTKTHKHSAYNAAKRRKHFHHEKNSLNERGNKSLSKNKERYPILSHRPSQTSSWNQTSHRRHQNPIYSNRVTEPPCLPYDLSTQRLDHFHPEVSQTLNWNQNSHRRHQDPIYSNRVTEPPSFPYHLSTRRLDHFQREVFPREWHHFPPHRGPLHNSVMNSIPRWNEFSRGSFADPGYLHYSSSTDTYR